MWAFVHSIGSKNSAARPPPSDRDQRVVPLPVVPEPDDEPLLDVPDPPEEPEPPVVLPPWVVPMPVPLLLMPPDWPPGALAAPEPPMAEPLVEPMLEFVPLLLELPALLPLVPVPDVLVDELPIAPPVLPLCEGSVEPGVPLDPVVLVLAASWPLELAVVEPPPLAPLEALSSRRWQAVSDAAAMRVIALIWARRESVMANSFCSD
jgi:hypothetical protein